jgi:hypothetical protein
VYEWIKAGYLLSEEVHARGLSVSPASLVKLMAILDQWENDGRPGRPSRALRQWAEGELDLRERRREFAAKRKDGTVGLKPRAGLMLGQQRHLPCAVASGCGTRSSQLIVGN